MARTVHPSDQYPFLEKIEDVNCSQVIEAIEAFNPRLSTRDILGVGGAK